MMTDNRARRSGRITLAVPILLIGSDSEGKVFSEQTHTVMLSLHGAGIVSRYKLVAEQQLILREKATNREAEIRVVGEIGQQGRTYTYGVAFLDDKLPFWLMEFPAGPAEEEQPAVLRLECGGCGDVMDLANGDYEYDICAIHGGLAQYCKECGLLTVWRKSRKEMRGERRVTAGPVRRETGLVTELAEMVEMGEPRKRAANVTGGAERKEARPATERAEPAAMTKPNNDDSAANVTALAEAVDRRSRVRAKVNFFACVKTDVFGDDVVRCIDMSKGGVSFRSQHAYTQEMKLEIAVPFSAEVKEAPAIFVRGRIANVREMGGEMWRCGVEFLWW
jgi:hypothetical protein